MVHACRRGRRRRGRPGLTRPQISEGVQGEDEGARSGEEGAARQQEGGQVATMEAPAGSVRGYRKEWLRPDVIAGLTAAAVVIPKAMAYATIAGLPVEVGLYTAFIPMLIYAALGSSRVLSVSTSTTIAILTGAALSQAVPQGDAAS